MMLPLNAHRIRYLFLIRFSVHDKVLQPCLLQPIKKKTKKKLNNGDKNTV